MPSPVIDIALTSEILDMGDAVIKRALVSLDEHGGINANETFAYDLAHSASALVGARSCLDYARLGEDEARLVNAFVAIALTDLAGRVFGRESIWGLDEYWYSPFRAFVATYRDSQFLSSIAESHAPSHLGDEFEMVSTTFHRFADEQVRPHAELVHRSNGDIPESIITGLGELGGFGLSIPEEYGGYSAGGESEYIGMVVATEELSWGSLGIGGSLITRPEIVTRALLKGGTEIQRTTWLPRIATGELLCAIAVTEPDFGSDVASITTFATKTDGGWLISGTKTWCTFGARAEVLALLARTDLDRSLGHRGLSMFLVEKPRAESKGFILQQDAVGEGRDDADGRLEGRPIDTIGYRGMHSFELSFDNWFVPDDNLVGGEEGVNKGFYLQMAGFENGRIQTVARALGVMQSAYDAAIEYARTRVVFGEPIINYELTRVKLGMMAATIQCGRQFALDVARRMGRGEGSLEASMAKAYVCRAAEWVTREAMQIHGGMGYAEEYAVSRYFLDARVLSIFEGADEILSLKVIARGLLGDVPR